MGCSQIFSKLFLILLVSQLVACEGRITIKGQPEKAENQEEVLPPVAKKVPHVDNFHGDPRIDNYRWMHNSEDPEVIEHLKAENRYAEKVLEKHSELIAELKFEYEGLRQDVSKELVTSTETYLFFKTKNRDESYWRWYRRHKVTGVEELVFDEDSLAEGQGFYQTLSFSVSPDENKALIVGDFAGRRTGRPHLVNLLTKEVIALPSGYLWHVAYLTTSVLWLDSNRVLFLGNTNEIDPQEVYSYDVTAKAERLLHKFDETDSMRQFEVSNDGFYKGVTLSKTKSSKAFIYREATDSLELFSPRREGVTEYFLHNSQGWYKRSNELNENFGLYKKNGDSWDVVFEPETGNLRNVILDEEQAVLHLNNEGLESLIVLDLVSKTTRSIPASSGVLSYSDIFLDKAAKKLYYSSESFAQPTKSFSCSLADCDPQLEIDTVMGDFNSSEYEARRISVTARDGAEVPVTLVYKKSLYTGQDMMVHLLGYGSYGFSLTPMFRVRDMPLLNRGVLYAIAHIRGGGEKGTDWHDQGRYFNKMNSFTDFIDVSKYFIESGMTSSSKLSIVGRSAGGLLMGAVLNMAPELYKVASVGVPFLDVLNTMTLYYDPLAKFEKKEWGDGLIQEEYELIKSYDPYTNLTQNSFPSIQVHTGFEDSAVYYFQPMKWVAKFRELNPVDENRPLIFKTSFDAGHSGGTEIDDIELEYAKEIGFILGELGYKGSSK